MDDDSFIVRPAKSLSDLLWTMEEANAQGWRLRYKDAECLFSIDYTKYFFVGELNGKRISSICFVKYGEEFHLGLYVVSEKYRGKGYGYRTWKAASEASGVDQHSNVAVWAAENMIPAFNKRGFQSVYGSCRYQLTVENVLQAFSASKSPEGIRIEACSDLDIGKLASYDEKIFGASRLPLLTSWLCVCDVSVAALNEKNEIVGYIFVRKTMVFEDGGYRVTPLYSNTPSIACYLLKCAFEQVPSANGSSIVNIIVPTEGNQESVKMVQLIPQAKPICDITLMSTKGTCSMDRSKVFGIVSYAY